MAELAKGHHNLVKPLETNLTGIATEPKFAIGQRILLVQTPQGTCYGIASAASTMPPSRRFKPWVGYRV
jgi:hypothetical protein